MGLWKSLKVHFEGKAAIYTSDAGTADRLKGEGSFSLSRFYRNFRQFRRKGNRESIPEWWGWQWEIAVRFGEDSQYCQGPCSQDKMVMSAGGQVSCTVSPWGGTLPGGQNPFPISIYQWNIMSGVSHLTHFFLTKGYFYETATAGALQCINTNEKHIYYAREIKFIGK